MVSTITHNDGKAYIVDAMTQLRRFLIIGSTGNTYYASAQDLLKTNVTALQAALDQDYVRAVDIIVEVSTRGLAPSNEPALFALAAACSQRDNVDCRRYAFSKLNEVARIGTHLFHFMHYLSNMRSHGHQVKKAIQNWYQAKSPMDVVFQATKYQSRDGYSHKDLINIAHLKGRTKTELELYRYLTYGDNIITSDAQVQAYLEAIQEAKTADTGRLCQLIQDYNLPREVLPTESLVKPEVWQALIPVLGYQALLRNLATMTRIGLVTPMSDAESLVRDKLTDATLIKRSRIHPIDIIKAKFTYDSGRGFRGTYTWTPLASISEALETAFYESFQYVEPTGKRGIIALDVSASMTHGIVADVPGFTPRIASAVMAMVSVRREPEVLTFAFSSGIVPFPITKHMSLNEVTTAMSKLPFSTTDCELPMRYALDNHLPAEYFIIYTDSETSGDPESAMNEFRNISGIQDSKMIIVGMIANRLTLANPNDPYSLNVAGFDSSAPAVISEFIRGVI